MSLRFYFGPSDEELCKKVYEEIITRSLEDIHTNYLVIVPDQFTMQTQKQLVSMHPQGGILNIDVLSFGRLHHRIMEELGQEGKQVLDDTGKSLILQKVASGLKDKCPVLGGYLNRQGYIHEIKSAISEFMQYGIGVQDVEKLIAFSEGRGALTGKLRDLQTIYGGFVEYIGEHFITTEEVMEILRQNLSKSKIVKDSVVVLCGFTGFTPIQNRLVQELMSVSKELIMTLTLGEGENPYVLGGEQELFYLTKKTVAQLEELAWDAKVSRDRTKDKFCNIECEQGELHFLTKSFFRYGMEPYDNPCESIHLFEATSSKEEVRRIASYIKELTLAKGYAYRDIAVILGDMEESAPFVEREFERLGIPCFLDASRGIRLNPLVEYIRSALNLFLKDFSYDAVMHYLRTGMTDFALEEIDQFENYLLETGIKGLRKYKKMFVLKTKGMSEEGLLQIQTFQEKLMDSLKPIWLGATEPVKVYVEGLYEFLVEQRVQEKLATWEHYFEEQLDASRAKEYGQIYRFIMELLEQVHALLGDDEITQKEFYDILDAGFGEIQVGIIPKQVDRVLVGDMQRTRLHDVKVLFFAGVNDGNIPKNVSKGGIISDMDREFLQQSALELAPTPRQQMYIQRFYLYLNMTKPKDALYVSYARIGADGKSRRPSYLFGELKSIFPKLQMEYPEKAPVLAQIHSKEEGMDFLASSLREYAAGLLSEEQRMELQVLYDVFEIESNKREKLENAAFYEHKDNNLPKMVALALYGHVLTGSVTKFENYAKCAYRYFIEYGLGLQERPEFGLERMDLGNIYHEVIETFSKNLSLQNKDWTNFDEAYAKQEIHKSMEAISATYGAAVLYSSHRNIYVMEQMEKILLRTIMTMQSQLNKGQFVPKKYELAFSHVEELSGMSLALSEQEKISLKGRIDRVDVLEEPDRVLVKIMDYKSSKHQFDLVALYHGLDLQLVVYMKYALDQEKKKHPDKEVLPAGMLYYTMMDPTVESSVELPAEQLQEKILAELKTTGVVTDEKEVLLKIDKELEAGKSITIPVGFKKDGDFASGSKIISQEDFQTVSEFVNKKLVSMGGEILNGNISLSPSDMGDKKACSYCAFKEVCGFDTGIPGCELRSLPKFDTETVLKKMKE